MNPQESIRRILREETNKKITLPKSSFVRRYQEIKNWVKSDYNYLLDKGYPPEVAKEITIDHSTDTYLDDYDTDIKFSDKNRKNLIQFIENNFKDLIS
jgi:hypothetical protein